MTVSNFDESVGGGTGALAEVMNGMRHLIAASSTVPATKRLTASGLTDSSGNVLLTLGQCPQGRKWYLRSLAVGGGTWSTTATGTLVVFVQPGQPPTTDTAPSTNYIRDALPPVGGGTQTLPGIAFYDSGHIPIQPQEWLFVWVSNGTAASGTQYVAGATIDDMSASASVAATL